MHTLQIALTILLLSVAGPALSILSMPRATQGLLLVLSPPWGAGTIEAEILAAGGRGIGTARAPFGTLVQADDAEFAQRLHAAAPVLILDGRALASLCGVNG